MSPMSPGSHFISMSYISSRLMHYVSPLSPGSHQVSTPFTFNYFGRSRSPVSHMSHYMNHVKIYPFSDVLCPQWALGATSYQCHIYPAAWCTMCPHWAQGATRLQRLLHLPISDVPGPLWAIGATTWTTSRSIHFQTFYVPNEPWESHIHLAALCTLCPHWAPGATRLQYPLHLAISDVLGPLRAIWATIWTTSRSIHFQTFYVPSKPKEPLHTNVIYI